MASTQKLPSGRYRGVYRDSGGNRQYTETVDLKRDAYEAAQEAEVKARRQAAARRGTLSPHTTYGEWVTVCRAEKSFDSDYGYVLDSILSKHVQPEWQDIELVAIEQPAVQAWVDALCRSGYSPRYVRGIFDGFRAFVRAAIPKVITADPTSGIKLPPIPRRPKPYLGVSDEPLIAKLGQPWRDATELMKDTGLRPGEVCGLHAHRVEDGWLTIADVYVNRRKVIRPWPKDKEARRVPLSAKALEIIERNLGQRKGACPVPHLGEKCRHPLVFMIDSWALTPGQLRYRLKATAEKHELPRKTPYAARRGYATTLAEGGLDAFVIADMLGHSDLAMAREYVQQTPSARARVLNALGDAQPLSAVRQRDTARDTDSPKEPPSATGKSSDEKGA